LLQLQDNISFFELVDGYLLQFHMKEQSEKISYHFLGVLYAGKVLTEGGRLGGRAEMVEDL
jgi:hypothetical protein